MTTTALFRDIVKAFALGDTEQARRLDAQLTAEDRDAFNIFVTAMFFGAVGHRFENDDSREAIKAFVDEMRSEYADAQPPLKPLVIEGLIRAAFGEEYFLDEISPDEQLMFQFPIIHKIVTQSPHMQERLDDYLTDAGRLAAEWSQ